MGCGAGCKGQHRGDFMALRHGDPGQGRCIIEDEGRVPEDGEVVW